MSTSDEDVKKRESNKVRKQTLKTFREITTGLELYKRNIAKLNKIEDPAIKFSMMALFFDMLLDTGITVIMRVVINEDLEDLLPEDLHAIESVREKLNIQSEEAREICNDFFEKMRHWIVSPSYAPDSGLGNKIMKDANTDLKSKSEAEK